MTENDEGSFRTTVDPDIVHVISIEITNGWGE